VHTYLARVSFVPPPPPPPFAQYVLPQSNQKFSASWDDLWQAYTAANAMYASVVSHCVDSPTDTIWVHNYHLLLLPSFLRTKLPRAKIGLFIHTPFPSSDVFRVLPTRQNILSSIMAADLVRHPSRVPHSRSAECMRDHIAS
jgi:trehalose 6-phosphate synthase/phosphatase